MKIPFCKPKIYGLLLRESNVLKPPISRTLTTTILNLNRFPGTYYKKMT